MHAYMALKIKKVDFFKAAFYYYKYFLYLTISCFF